MELWFHQRLQDHLDDGFALPGFIAITDRSVPAPRIGTRLLAGLPLGGLPWHRGTGSHVPHKSLSLASRRLHAGCHSVSRQAPSELRPRSTTGTWFWQRPYAFDTSATVHMRSSCQRSPDGLSRLFRNAHHPGHCAKAACGGLDPDPAIRVRGAVPHLLCSKAASIWLLHQSLLSAPSWRTVIRVAHDRDSTASMPMAPLMDKRSMALCKTTLARQYRIGHAGSVVHQRHALQPMKQVAAMIRNHFDCILALLAGELAAVLEQGPAQSVRHPWRGAGRCSHEACILTGTAS
jgi:hypothetical protein